MHCILHFNWHSVVARSIAEKQSLLHRLLHARDSCRSLKMLDLVFFCSLKVFIDSGDEVPCGFTHITNFTVCTNKFVNNEWLEMKWQWIFVWELATDLKWRKYNFNIYTFAKSFNKILNLFLSNVGIFANVW